MVMRIKQLRKAAGLTQTELGEAMGLDQRTVGNWESEVYLPRTRDLPRLAKVLGCSIDDLFASDPDTEAPLGA